ncbi:MAG: SDR family NAD(P)-dependent oxidoreductase [Salinisphaera sp.]|jgi:NADP-dependent 3-hydroxy acid dehydrogenase YdfG|nr:SDR family NAD(P)-dependent oxidoreductase [Salinisphaera sp.]
MNPPVCAIPGAGPGNGLALARRFAAAGYLVALIGRSAGRLQTFADGIEGASAYPCDAADERQVAETFAAIESDLGPVDALLYNAGAAMFGNIDRIGAPDFEAAWRTNALGLFHCATAVVPGMRSAGKGHIVVTGATASKKGGANFAGFAAAKAAQYSLAQSLARQLGPEGIHVAIAIVDGVIDIPRTREMMPDKPDEYFLAPEAIAESIYQITCQPRSAWTFELDLRPFAEKW